MALLSSLTTSVETRARGLFDKLVAFHDTFDAFLINVVPILGWLWRNSDSSLVDLTEEERPFWRRTNHLAMSFAWAYDVVLVDDHDQTW
jgi:hypothetical protein